MASRSWWWGITFGIGGLINVAVFQQLTIAAIYIAASGICDSIAETQENKKAKLETALQDRNASIKRLHQAINDLKKERDDATNEWYKLRKASKK